MYIAVNYKGRFVGVATMNQHPGPDHIVEIDDGMKLPDAVEHSSSSVPAHTGGATAATTSTSTGLAATHTMHAVHKLSSFSSVAIMVFLAVLWNGPCYGPTQVLMVGTSKLNIMKPELHKSANIFPILDG